MNLLGHVSSFVPTCGTNKVGLTVQISKLRTKTSAVNKLRPSPLRLDLPSSVHGRHHNNMVSYWEKSDSNFKLHASEIVESTVEHNTLDIILGRLTSAFPLFVLGSAILGLTRPSTLLWTNRGTLISWMLASVMCGTGLTLEKKDFTKVLGEDLKAVPTGVLCQFIIMPMTALLVGRKFLLNSIPHGESLFLGLVLVGCSPGGTASNLVALIAKADVALSVLLTSCSTIMASIVTPLLVKLLVGSTIEISGWALCEATARVVLLPVMFGMLVNAMAPNLASRVSRFTPFASVLLVSLICGGVVSQNASLFLQSTSLMPLIVGSVVMLHCVGFLAGYLVPRFGLKLPEISSRTISIETGMQNSALAVVLARSIGAPAVASLPGALSATAHSCLGSILAGYWHGRRQTKSNM